MIPASGRWRRAEELISSPDLRAARRTIEAYVGRDAAQVQARASLLAFVEAHPDALLRSSLAGHLTASALVLDARGERALLTLHAKLGRWLQLGGHCDGDGNLAAVALRECREESGIDDLCIDPRPIDLDLHRIPARPGEPEHWHLDTRFLVQAPPGARERAGEESHELRWFTGEEARRAGIDASVERLFALGLGAAGSGPAAGSSRTIPEDSSET